MSSDEPSHPGLTPARLRVAAHDRFDLEDGWEVASCAADACQTPVAADALDWLPATVPGTAAGALRAAGRWQTADGRDFDAEDWWFRTSFEAAPAEPGEEVVLCLDGVATVFEVYLNGEPILEASSMFEGHAIDVGARLRAGANELAIRCLALGPLLRVRRKPRARWRTRLADNGLRFFRTMLLGRAPGFAPGPAVVGPWRPVSIERRRGFAVRRFEAFPSTDGDSGVLTTRGWLQPLSGSTLEAASVELTGPDGVHRGELELRPSGEEVEVGAQIRFDGVRRWWPHTHGDPFLYELRLRLRVDGAELVVDAGRVGFRDLAAAAGQSDFAGPEEDGIDLHLNDTRVFARGALWTPIDPVGMAPAEEQLRTALEQVRDAGMNMLRIPGTAAYESPAFHDLCDELGILVWQDFMFANFDYPIADDDFRAAVEAEARRLLGDVGGRPSLTILCGNSEVEQQAAMLGLDPELGRGELFGELLREIAREGAPTLPYLPSAPCGGTRPFQPDRGVANYFGVGGYRRPLEDARRAGVRFASECLAISNVPDEAGVEAVAPGEAAGVVVHDPRWKAGVPRDAGTGWDFEDVRDHYLRLLFEVDPVELRSYDHERYLELSRAVSGEVMASVFSEWRRAGSPCGGGLVLWMRDLAPGAGWGLVDSSGAPKAAYHHLRRALAPTAVWITDEGLGGLDVHVANDGPTGLEGRLRVALYRDGEQSVGEASAELLLDPHSSLSEDAESLLGRFADVSWAYRFGPPAQDLIVASIEVDGGEEPLSQAFHFPAGRPTGTETVERLGIEAVAERGEGGGVSLRVGAGRFVYGLRIHAPGLTPTDDSFSIEPGVTRKVALRPTVAGEAGDTIRLSALNMQGRFTVPISPPASA